MIKLAKGPKPPVLVSNGDRWKSALLQALEIERQGAAPVSDAIKSRYRHRDIKAAVVAEASGKCAYCESKVTHVYPGDVEHIIAKDARPELTFEWENLAFGCFRCNNNKRAYYSETLPLINPYAEDPAQFFEALGPMLIAKLGEERARVTRSKLDLDRAELVERRMERLQLLLPLLEEWNKETRPEVKQLIKDELVAYSAPDREFSLIVRAFLEKMGVLP